MRAWLLADFLGQPRWRWLAFAAVLVALAAVWGWAACVAVPPWLLALRPSRAPQPADVPDPARAAQDAHRAAQETDRALAGVGRESVQREAQGAQAAATDPADEVAARVARRGRGWPVLPTDPDYEALVDRALRDRRGKP